jgi:arylsulfatase A-like enzyme
VTPCRRTYLAMVSKVDSVVGRIVSDLQRFTYMLEGEERSVFNDTIIIFSSDNGAMSQVYGCFFVNGSYTVQYSTVQASVREGCPLAILVSPYVTRV